MPRKTNASPMLTYKEKLLDPRWQKKRLEVFKRDGFSCFWCGDKDTTLHVHHELYIGQNPWDTPDYCLFTLCEECHYINHLPLTKLEELLIFSLRNRHMRDFDQIKLLNRVVKNYKEEDNG